MQLVDGRILPADVVVLATGYKSSWDNILNNVRDELGLRRDLLAQDDEAFLREWNYASLDHPPPLCPDIPIAASVYRGLVPAKTMDRRDVAMNGAIVST